MKNFILVLIALSTLFFACKKESTTPIETPVYIPKIQTETYYSNTNIVGSFTNYIYDSQGRCIKTLESDGSSKIYEYTGTTFIYKEYNNLNVLLYSGTGNINTQNQLISMSITNLSTNTVQSISYEYLNGFNVKSNNISSNSSSITNKTKLLKIYLTNIILSILKLKNV